MSLDLDEDDGYVPDEAEEQRKRENLLQRHVRP